MYDKYSDICLENSLKTANEWNFKSNSDYQVILEHLNFNDGFVYLDIINKEFNEFFNIYKSFLIELCNINDTFGKPNKINYIGFCECSPTSIRYIYHALLNLNYIKNELKKNEIDIIEIGGGYGGLCFFMNNLSSFFDIKITSYSIFDLYNTIKLQEIYLKTLNIDNFKCYSLYSHNNDNNYCNNLKYNSYLISIYSFSEFSSDIQELYKNLIIIPYITNGFILWNNIKPYNILNKVSRFEIERPNYRIIKSYDDLNYFNYI